MGGAEPFRCKYTEKIFIREGDLYEPLDFLQGPDAGPGYRMDIPERDAFPEQTDFLLVLVLVGIVTFAVGGWSAHLDPFPAALGDIQVTTARHTLLDSQPLHRRYLEENCADERCDRIDLAVGVEGVEVVVLNVEGDPILVEVVDDFEGFERVSPEAADFEAYDPVQAMLLDILHQCRDFLSVGEFGRSADLVGEYLHYFPVHSLAVVREFHHLPFVVLPLCRDPCQNCYLFH